MTGAFHLGLTEYLKAETVGELNVKKDQVRCRMRLTSSRLPPRCPDAQGFSHWRQLRQQAFQTARLPGLRLSMIRMFMTVDALQGQTYTKFMRSLLYPYGLFDHETESPFDVFQAPGRWKARVGDVAAGCWLHSEFPANAIERFNGRSRETTLRLMAFSASSCRVMGGIRKVPWHAPVPPSIRTFRLSPYRFFWMRWDKPLIHLPA